MRYCGLLLMLDVQAGLLFIEMGCIHILFARKARKTMADAAHIGLTNNVVHYVFSI